jgi:hypothetical protein
MKAAIAAMIADGSLTRLLDSYGLQSEVLPPAGAAP